MHRNRGREDKGGLMKAKTILMAYQDDSWVKSLSTVFHDKGYRVETARVVSEIIREDAREEYACCPSG